MKTKEEYLAGAQGRDSSEKISRKGAEARRTQREEEIRFFLGSIA